MLTGPTTWHHNPDERNCSPDRTATPLPPQLSWRRLRGPYYWLQDPNYPQVDDADVLAYLKAENDYFESWFAPHQGLTQTLFEELKSRKPEQDESVPYEKNGYRYQWRFRAGDQYRIWLRQPITLSLGLGNAFG